MVDSNLRCLRPSIVPTGLSLAAAQKQSTTVTRIVKHAGAY